jgi:hypothetical protein
MPLIDVRWEVRAETHEGNEFRLRGNFDTREAAEDHPVKLSLWKRVWVQEMGSSSRARLPGVPSQASLRLPWRREDRAGGRFTYIRDADGRRILSLHGAGDQRDRLFAMLVEAGLCQTNRDVDAAD